MCFLLSFPSGLFSIMLSFLGLFLYLRQAGGGHRSQSTCFKMDPTITKNNIHWRTTIECVFCDRRCARDWVCTHKLYVIPVLGTSGLGKGDQYSEKCAKKSVIRRCGCHKEYGRLKVGTNRGASFGWCLSGLHGSSDLWALLQFEKMGRKWVGQSITCPYLATHL